jgi:hypothetical protein
MMCFYVVMCEWVIFAKCLFNTLKCCWCIHAIIRYRSMPTDFVKWMYMFKFEYYLTMIYKCLNAIDVFFYLNLYTCLCIPRVGHILTLLNLDCTLAGCRFTGRRELVAVSSWRRRWCLLIYLFAFLEFYRVDALISNTKSRDIHLFIF